MAKKDVADMSVEQKLKNLYQLQTTLSEVDRIKTLRGELPLEVQDLEDEIEGLTHRIAKFNEELEGLHTDIANKKAKINDANRAIELPYEASAHIHKALQIEIPTVSLRQLPS